jgi:hypothetical protein
MNKRTLIAGTVIGLVSGLPVMLMVGSNLRDATRELERMREDRVAVTRIEKFIEQRSPHLPAAMRRGYAEWTVETGWPVEPK